MAQLRDTASGVEVRLSKLEQLGALHRGQNLEAGARPARVITCHGYEFTRIIVTTT